MLPFMAAPCARPATALATRSSGTMPSCSEARTGAGGLGGHRCRRPPSGGLLLVRGVVRPVVHRLEPGGGVAAVRALLEDGEVAHEGVGGRAVPVLLIRGADE